MYNNSILSDLTLGSLLLLIIGSMAFPAVKGITNESCQVEGNSSVIASDTGRYTQRATELFDRNGSTHWNPTTNSSWLEIDLGKRERICFVDIGWKGGQNSNEFVISTSYTSEAGFKDVFSGNSTTATFGLERYDFKDITARYLKITFLNVTKGTPGIAEINVYKYNPTNTSSRFPLPPTLPLYDDFVSNNDKKWVVKYTGHGFAGIVTTEGDGSNYQMYPAVSKSINETHATLVRSKDKFSDFKVVADVMTEEQLRQNSSPNPWEVAWILFRYTDTFHYYWFTLKPNGFELGKKDCNSCIDPAEGQIILLTGSLPTLKIGYWSQWTIDAKNNHIMISVDGNRIIDYVDANMSKTLSTGQLVMYTEDAKVSFDNFYLAQYD
jgi:F5/8 type C domain/Domain of Unknown Function (DUF1080)